MFGIVGIHTVRYLRSESGYSACKAIQMSWGSAAECGKHVFLESSCHQYFGILNPSHELFVTPAAEATAPTYLSQLLLATPAGVVNSIPPAPHQSLLSPSP